MTENKKKEIPLYKGHRDRLRARFFSAGADALQDYELLEMLLFSAIPRRDTKPIAKELLNNFNGLWEILQSTPDSLRTYGLSDAVISSLLAMGAIAIRAQKKRILDRPILSSWQHILNYCVASLGHEKKEQSRVMFFDRKNRMLGDEIQQKGTIDQTTIYPREIVQRALELGAGAIVLVHNHPAGNPDPSKLDIEMTRNLQKACDTLSISLHDHLIIGRGGLVTSFKSLGLL
jgi:DNA repair protein RadC